MVGEDSGGDPVVLFSGRSERFQKHGVTSASDHGDDARGEGLGVREDDAFAGGEDTLGGAEVFLEVDDGGVVVALELGEDFLRGGAAPFVDSLVDIAEEAKLAVGVGKEVEDAVFGAGGVLDFIALNPVIAGLPPGEAVGVLGKEMVDAENEVSEVDSVGVAEEVDVVGGEGGEVEIGGLVGRPETAGLNLGGEDFAGLLAGFKAGEPGIADGLPEGEAKAVPLAGDVDLVALGDAAGDFG